VKTQKKSFQMCCVCLSCNIGHAQILGALGGMDPYRYRPSSAHNVPFWTSNQGTPIWKNNSSLIVGERGECFIYSENILFLWLSYIIVTFID
jgi:hypothetical protein